MCSGWNTVIEPTRDVRRDRTRGVVVKCVFIVPVYIILWFAADPVLHGLWLSPAGIVKTFENEIRSGSQVR